MIGVQLDAGDHPARVVGDDPADSRGSHRGGVGPDLSPELAQNPVVHLPSGARLRLYASPSVENLDSAKGGAYVGNDALADSLARKTRRASPERHRKSQLAGYREEASDVVLAGDADHGLGAVLIKAAVSGVDTQRDLRDVYQFLGEHST